MRVVLKKSVAIHPFYGTTDDVIEVPDELAKVLFEDGAAEELSARNQRLEAAKLNAMLEKDAPAAPVADGEPDPALAGLEHLFEKQNAGVPVAPAADASESEVKKPSRK